ncbi:G5 domain-containing protein [Mesobacillus subterraneus]|uniref:G5 domain-containing protein n=1 Tax=Mesobacillus subterraneus TaxID=285983 RepID=UPI00203A637F|nr:G5 domain-containing protein [Mesobacillus subterraneus]MCM3663827.1 G5 domain-containing protein [Mesobacillus subterraneus]MCM3683588.1 G5 domain-containing protein [Mesobacillus subterraneus]
MDKVKSFKFTGIMTIAALFIFGFSQFSTVVYSSFIEKDTYDEQTSIGRISLSEKSIEQADSLLEEQIKNWQESASYELTYKGNSQKLDPNSFIFLVHDSVESAMNGKENPLLVEVNQKKIEDTLYLVAPILGIHALDMAGLLNRLSSAASELEPSLSIKLEDFLPKEDPVVVATATRELSEEFSDIETFVQELPQIPVDPLTNVSLKQIVEEKGLNHLSSQQLGIVTSGIFEVLMSTNFTITERNTGRELPRNINLGLEAKVDFTNDIDFSFYNPNENRYEIKLSINESQLEISILGVPFSSDYRLILAEKQEFKPRTIKRYTPLLEPNQKSVEEEGKPGLLIKVYRESISSSGELIKSELISEDFYQPIHRVEVHGIDPNAQMGQQEETDSESLPNADLNNGTTSENQIDNTDVKLPAVEEENQQKNSDEMTGDSEDRLWGKPNEEPK